MELQQYEKSKFRVFAAYFLATVLVVYVSLSFILTQQESDGLLRTQQRESVNESSCTSKSGLDKNVTFSQLSKFLLDNYDIAIGDNETPYKDKLYNAIMGMYFAEHDGNPVPIKEHPYLFVGSVGATYNREVLQENGITHIIGLSKSTRPRFPNDFVYMSIEDLEDSPKSDITPYIKDTNRFIDKARSEKGKVLVHCWLGQSRSVSIILAYLMRTDHIRFKEALALVRETRPEAGPIAHFVRELKDYERKIFNDS